MLLLTDISRLFSWQTVLTKKGVHQTKKSTEWHTHWIYLLLSNCYFNDGSSQRQQKSYNPKKVLLPEGKKSWQQHLTDCNSNFWHSALAWYMRQVFLLYPWLMCKTFLAQAFLYANLWSDLASASLYRFRFQSFEQIKRVVWKLRTSMLPIIPYVNRVKNKHAREMLIFFFFQAQFSSPTVCKGLCLSKEKMDQVHFL